MIAELKLKNIRGIATGAIADLSPINVFVGPNNSGKSTLLDALYIGAHANPSQAVGVIQKRQAVSDPQRWFIHRSNGNGSTVGEIALSLDTKADRIISISTSHNISVSCSREVSLRSELKDLEACITNSRGDERQGLTARKREISRELADTEKLTTHDWPVPEVIMYDPQRPAQGRSLPELYTLAAESGLSDQVNGILTDLLPDVKRVELLAPQGKPVVYLSMKSGGALPVGIAGDGVRLLIRLSMELAVKQGGVALLEEPETHLHPGAIRQAARAIHAAVGRDVQIALSTHSLELIDALLAESPDRRGRVTVFRTAIDEHGALLTHRVEGHEAFDARAKIAEDLR